MGETLPLATIQAAVFEFLQNRDDVFIFSAQVVNAWVANSWLKAKLDYEVASFDEPHRHGEVQQHFRTGSVLHVSQLL